MLETLWSAQAMNQIDLHTLSTNQLVERFTDIGLQKYQQLLRNDVTKFNKLYDQMAAIVQELRSRPDDERRALIALYVHPNFQVRMKAAVNSLALNYDAARHVLEEIASS